MNVSYSIRKGVIDPNPTVDPIYLMTLHLTLCIRLFHPPMQ